MSGIFITLEGGEGSGKTTQARLLSDALNAVGVKVLLTREPGGVESAEAIRELLLTGAGDKWYPLTELLLFQAARNEHVERAIKPALLREEVVICDRFLDSSLVYQGIAHGLGQGYIRSLHQMTLGDFLPDITFYVDIAPEIGLKRAAIRHGHETRFESLDIAFHSKVRAGFLELARKEPERIQLIDGRMKVEEVHDAIMAEVKTRLRRMV